ncbi:hypothetical protein H696_01141 [Fonticula alba]|uniref:GAMM1 protein n=1 Tax=Fonticula alba TaxID=691883 RepID=A0A058ZBE1_FONAL|nr:hypothetical protein H696_01141 [Fonticula alba]KCV71719.1 hypothetical protein H696_01141 [Fonticula alba]|eukprot:XP_009493297.1 hypothetical protein H696_01141 [Fonticula alba]
MSAAQPGTKIIATHSGTFHLDEALATYMLWQTEEFKGAQLVRSRDAEVLATADVVYDVGSVYDPASHRYDHHQREFSDVFGHGFTTRLSSAGLIYRHFGREIVAKKVGIPESDPSFQAIYLRLYRSFIHMVDAIDNGVGACPCSERLFMDSTSLNSRISRFLPRWDEEETDMDERFKKAVALAGEEFEYAIEHVKGTWLPTRNIVRDALRARFDHHPSGQIMVFDSFAPWQQHLFDLEIEDEIPEAQRPLYILMPSPDSFRIRAVGISPTSFESRKALPAPWRGLRDGELSTVAGVEDCTFVHASGFIGGNATFHGALQMAIRAIEH